MCTESLDQIAVRELAREERSSGLTSIDVQLSQAFLQLQVSLPQSTSSLSRPYIPLQAHNPTPLFAHFQRDVYRRPPRQEDEVGSEGQLGPWLVNGIEVDLLQVIGTHNGTFHCDEALAVYLLKHTKAYGDAGMPFQTMRRSVICKLCIFCRPQAYQGPGRA